MDDSSDGPTVLIPEPVAVLQVDGVLRHEDEVVQDHLLLRLFVVFDDRGQEEVEQAKHDEEDHEGEEDVGEHHCDRAPRRELEPGVLEGTAEVELGEAETHHDHLDAASPVVVEAPLFLLGGSLVLENPEPEGESVEKVEDGQVVHGDLLEDNVEGGGES